MTEQLSLADLKNSLGMPKQGVHSQRLFDYAVFDIFGTLILSILLCILLGFPWFFIIKDLNKINSEDKMMYWGTLLTFSIIVMFIYATIMHRLFNVETTLTKQVFSLNDKKIFFIVLRVLLGSIFIYHGFLKVKDKKSMESWIETMQYKGVPKVVAIFSAWLELIIGVCLVLGIVTHLSSLLAFAFMLCAIYLVHMNEPIIKYWYQICLLIVAIMLIISNKK